MYYGSVGKLVNPSDCLSEDCGFESHQGRLKSYKK